MLQGGERAAWTGVVAPEVGTRSGRATSLTMDYFDNERRAISELPAASTTLWKVVKDTQIMRFQGNGGGGLESCYL